MDGSWTSPPHERVSQRPDPFREGGFTVKLGGASPAQGMVNFESGPLSSVSDQQKALALGNRVYVVTHRLKGIEKYHELGRYQAFSHVPTLLQ